MLMSGFARLSVDKFTLLFREFDARESRETSRILFALGVMYLKAMLQRRNHFALL